MDEKTQVIEWISEAYSMQPIPIRVGNKLVNDKTIAKIELGVVKSNGDPFDYYNVYDGDGKLISQWKKECMNVGYK